MTRGDDAIASYKSGFTCSSAVFSTFSGEMGLDAETAKKVSCGFGAGMSRTGHICGAVSGGVLVIGLKYGKSQPLDNEATLKTRALVQEFVREFTAKNGSIMCPELLGYNLKDTDDYEKARQSGLFFTKCPDLVRDAVEILERLI